MAYRLLAVMRVELYRKLDALAPAYLLKRRSGDLVALATQDIETVEYFYAHTVAPAFVAVLIPGAVLDCAAVDCLAAGVRAAAVPGVCGGLAGAGQAADRPVRRRPRAVPWANSARMRQRRSRGCRN